MDTYEVTSLFSDLIPPSPLPLQCVSIHDFWGHGHGSPLPGYFGYLLLHRGLGEKAAYNPTLPLCCLLEH